MPLVDETNETNETNETDSTERIGKDNVAFPRLLVVRTQGSGEVDVGDVQTEYRERSYFVGRSGLLPYGSLGERGSLRMKCAGASVAGVFSAFREQIGWGVV